MYPAPLKRRDCGEHPVQIRSAAMADKKPEEKKPEEKKMEEKKHVCSVCGRPSDAVICHACEDKIRSEAFEKKRGL